MDIVAITFGGLFGLSFVFIGIMGVDYFISYLRDKKTHYKSTAREGIVSWDNIQKFYDNDILFCPPITCKDKEKDKEKEYLFLVTEINYDKSLGGAQLYFYVREKIGENLYSDVKFYRSFNEEKVLSFDESPEMSILEKVDEILVERHHIPWEMLSCFSHRE